MLIMNLKTLSNALIDYKTQATSASHQTIPIYSVIAVTILTISRVSSSHSPLVIGERDAVYGALV